MPTRLVRGLHVGWHLLSDEMGGVLGATNLGMKIQIAQMTIDQDVDTIRRLSGVLQTFHQMVFLPTLQDLIDALSAQGPSSGAGTT